MARVIEIVKAHLEANGFDGLVNGDAQCGCEMEDLVPCGHDCCQCEPGYKHADPRPDNAGGWAIWKQKETPTPDQWESAEY